MNRGILIYAHNSPELDYLEMAIFSSNLAKKNLGLPVALVSDPSTLKWGEGRYDLSSFDKIIEIQSPRDSNKRNLRDGGESSSIPFINGSRPSAFDVTPWDNTLLIDSDYLVQDSTLNEYWEFPFVKIGSLYSSVIGDEVGILDQYVSPVGIPMRWATTVMFDKSDYSRTFFDLVKSIKLNYTLYSELYKFDPRQYRNDIAFSIAQHTMNGYVDQEINLPPILTSLDHDSVISISDQVKLLSFESKTGKYVPVSIKSQNVHILNKQSLLRAIRAATGNS